MPNSLFARLGATSILLATALLALSCGSSKSGTGKNTGKFAAGDGGAGQTNAAHILVGVQVPGPTPFSTLISSDGTLTKANATVNHHSESNPSAINAAIDPSGNFFYQAVWPGIWAFTIDHQTGDLVEMSSSPYDDTVNFESVAMDQAGTFLYGYGNGQIYAYSIESGTGSLSPVAGSPFGAAPSGQQFAIATDRIAISQDDTHLYVATGTGIFGYLIDSNSGALTPITGSPFAASAGSSAALVAPSSGYLYETTTDGKSPILGFSIDPASGALSAIAGSPFGSNCGAPNLTSPASSKFLFASNCGMYQVDQSNGTLTFLFADPAAANGSFWAVFDPTGAFLWILNSPNPCFHCDIGPTAFQVDPDTGNLTMVSNSFFMMTNSEVGGIQSLAITQ